MNDQRSKSSGRVLGRSAAAPPRRARRRQGERDLPRRELQKRIGRAEGALLNEEPEPRRPPGEE
jgi:hypothetical protein